MRKGVCLHYVNKGLFIMGISFFLQYGNKDLFTMWE